MPGMTPTDGCAVAAPSITFRPPAGHIALVVVIFFAALAGSCVLLKRCLPFPDVPVVQEKLEQFTQHGDDFDLVFLGSSRVYFQILPSIFDRIAGEHGVPMQSFNAGIGAMVPPEDSYVLDQILRRPHRRLRWVIFEIMPLHANFDPILAETGRLTYWRDWPRTRLLTERFGKEWAEALRGANGRAVGWPAQFETCCQALEVWLGNVGLFVRNYCNLGRGEELFARQTGRAKKSGIRLVVNGQLWDGWDYPKISKPMAANEKKRTEYEEALDGLLRTEQRFDFGDSVSRETLSAKLARLAEAGVTPIMIIPPTVAEKRYYPTPIAGQSLTIWDFSDPRQYPELFSVDHRLDGMHLNAAGAEIFTKAIAEKFVEIAKSGGPLR